MIPIPTWPPASNPMWVRAAQFVNECRARGKSNPFIIAGLVNAYAESAIKPLVVGDHGEAVSIDQWHGDRAARILAKTGIDVKTETSIKRLVDAILWEMENVYPKTLAKIDAATTGADATSIWCIEYEGAGAPDAVQRRVAEAPYMEVWVSQNAAFIAANPAV